VHTVAGARRAHVGRIALLNGPRDRHLSGRATLAAACRRVPFQEPFHAGAPTHSVAMRRVAGVAGRALRDAGRRLDAGLGVSSSAAAEAAAAPAAAVGAKPSNLQEFKVYRWNPEVAGDKPRLQTYKARRRHRRRRVRCLPPGCRATPRCLPQSAVSAAPARRTTAARDGVARPRKPLRVGPHSGVAQLPL
jgi:hypothetical protein